MLHSTDKIIKHKVGLLNLAEELGNVSKACKVMGSLFRAITMCLNEMYVKIDPLNKKVWDYKGMAFQGRSQWDEAIECFDGVLKIDPSK